MLINYLSILKFKNVLKINQLYDDFMKLLCTLSLLLTLS